MIDQVSAAEDLCHDLAVMPSDAPPKSDQTAGAGRSEPATPARADLSEIRVTDPLGTPQTLSVETATEPVSARELSDLPSRAGAKQPPSASTLEGGEAPQVQGTEDTPGMTKKERDTLFRQTYDQEFNYVWHSLRRFGVWDRDLEDAAHDCFVVIHRKFHDYDPSRPLKPWLVGIAFRVASDFRRRAQHRYEIVSDEVEAVDDRQDAVAQVAAKEQRMLVHAALDTLDEDKRAVMVLHEIEGHSIPAVAEMLEVPLNTCYSRLRLARERFSAAVRRLQAQQQARLTGPRLSPSGGSS